MCRVCPCCTRTAPSTRRCGRDTRASALCVAPGCTHRPQSTGGSARSKVAGGRQHGRGRKGRHTHGKEGTIINRAKIVHRSRNMQHHRTRILSSEDRGREEGGGCPAQMVRRWFARAHTHRRDLALHILQHLQAKLPRHMGVLEIRITRVVGFNGDSTWSPVLRDGRLVEPANNTAHKQRTNKKTGHPPFLLLFSSFLPFLPLPPSFSSSSTKKNQEYQ